MGGTQREGQAGPSDRGPTSPSAAAAPGPTSPRTGPHPNGNPPTSSNPAATTGPAAAAGGPATAPTTAAAADQGPANPNNPSAQPGPSFSVQALQNFLAAVPGHEKAQAAAAQSDLLSQWHRLSAEHELLERRLIHFSEEHNASVAALLGRQQEGLEELTEEDAAPLEAALRARLKEIVSKQCLNVVKALMGQKCAWPFNSPVDIGRYRDYTSRIAEPIDLGTIRSRLEAGKHYERPSDVEADVRRVFTNAREYNMQGSDVHIMASILEDRLEEKWGTIVLPKLKEVEVQTDNERLQLRRRKAELARRRLLADGARDADKLLTDVAQLQRSILDASSLAASLCSPLSEEERKELSVLLAAQPLETRVAWLKEARLCAGKAAFELGQSVAQSVALDSLDSLELRILQALARPRGYSSAVDVYGFHTHGGMEKGAGVDV